MSRREALQGVIWAFLAILAGVMIFITIAQTPVNPAWRGGRDPVATWMAQP